jgi:hypothetical protein
MNKIIMLAGSVLAVIFSEITLALNLPEDLTMIDLKGTKFIVKKSSGVALTGIVIPSKGMSAAETAQDIVKESNCKILSSSSVIELLCQDNSGSSKSINLISQADPDHINHIYIRCGEIDIATCRADGSEILNSLGSALNGR